MNNIFLVTSGLNVESGLVHPEIRLQQTIQTAQSIRDRVPGVAVILLEGGKSPLTLSQRSLLNDHYDHVLDFTNHNTVQFAHNQNVNVMYIKGPCEALMLSEACKLIDFPIDRVFKISGRYQLTDDFDINHHTVPGKYVVKTRESGVRYYHDNKNDPSSQLQNIDQYYTEYQYKTRLYSFCGSLLPLATKLYHSMFQVMVGSYINHGFIDIEHTFYRTVNQSLIQEIDTIGVSGIQAENLSLITE